MINKTDLNEIYKQNLEEDIIDYLSKTKKIDLRKAMDIYYHSKLAEQITQGLYGIENCDYRRLAEDLMENERDLFC